nr:feruloyl CoA ortho-hydroxylase 2-like [Ipomoea trifida]
MAPAALSGSESVVDFVVNEGRGVKGLSDMGIKALPRQYIQPPKERIAANAIVSDDSIPTIDVSNWDDPAVARAVCEAAEEWGFFQIINHGVPVELLESLKAATYRFFRLPVEEKRKYSKANSPSENVRYGTSFSPESEKTLEWKDYLSLFYVSDDEASALWPPACRHEAIEYTKQCNAMIKNLLEMLMRGLNIQEQLDESKEPLFMGSKRINFNYYPKCPNPELAVGVGRHSDISTITVLLQDQIGGLHVRKLHSQTWVHVPPVHGALVINIGDALQILSNGRYKSAEHRVSANGSSDRISVPIFVTPDPNCRVGPLPEVLAGGEKPIYKELVYSDYLRHFFGKGHDGKETIEFAKI